MLTFTKRQGVADVEALQLMTESANGGYTALTDKYDGTETMLCVLWPGDDQAATTTLPATWDDGPGGKVRIVFPLETMTVLAVTFYSGLLTLADGSAALAEFRVEVEAGPGTATAPKTYHAYSDLIDELPWIGKLADQLNDQSGFVEVAAAARKWIDATILRSVPDANYGFYTAGVGYGYGGSMGYSSGYGYGYGGGLYSGGLYGALGQAQDPTIAAALDADKLILTTATGSRFVEASVYYTIAKILRRAIGVTSNNDLLTLSNEYKDMAERKLTTCVAEIDADDDGVSEYVFPLSRARMRRM